MPLTAGTPGRRVSNAMLAFNLSGQGYGAFDGNDPVLVGVGAAFDRLAGLLALKAERF